MAPAGHWPEQEVPPQALPGYNPQSCSSPTHLLVPFLASPHAVGLLPTIFPLSPWVPLALKGPLVFSDGHLQMARSALPSGGWRAGLASAPPSSIPFPAPPASLRALCFCLPLSRPHGPPLLRQGPVTPIQPHAALRLGHRTAPVSSPGLLSTTFWALTTGYAQVSPHPEVWQYLGASPPLVTLGCRSFRPT